MNDREVARDAIDARAIATETRLREAAGNRIDAYAVAGETRLRAAADNSVSARAVAESVVRTNFWRRPTWELDGEAKAHREWYHFSIGAPDLTLLVNLSVVDDTRPFARRGAERGRVIVLVRTNGVWDGEVDEVDSDQLEIHGGSLFSDFGDHRVEFRDGAFRLSGCLRRRRIAFDLVMRPLSFPSMASNVAIGREEEPINWVVVPTLVAEGSLSVGATRFEIRGASAYHDHNWGYFTHRDFSWQWGHAFADDPSNPFSLVFTRLLNGARTTSFMQAVLLWRAGRQHRVLREAEVRVSEEGFLRREPFTVPRSGRLLGGGTATDVPKRIRFEARGGDDVLVGTFESEDVARIALTNEHDLGTTLIHEVLGTFHLRGRVREEPVDFDGRAVFEFLGKGP